MLVGDAGFAAHVARPVEGIQVVKPRHHLLVIGIVHRPPRKQLIAPGIKLDLTLRQPLQLEHDLTKD